MYRRCLHNAEIFYRQHICPLVLTRFSSNCQEHCLARSFNLSIDDVLWLNNTSFEDSIHRIYPKELGIKDTTDIAKSASYLDQHLKIDKKGKLLAKLYVSLSYVMPELAVTMQIFFFVMC